MSKKLLGIHEIPEGSELQVKQESSSSESGYKFALMNSAGKVMKDMVSGGAVRRDDIRQDAVNADKIEAEAVEYQHLHKDLIDDHTSLGAVPADADQLLLSDTGTSSTTTDVSSLLSSSMTVNTTSTYINYAGSEDGSSFSAGDVIRFEDSSGNFLDFTVASYHSSGTGYMNISYTSTSGDASSTYTGTTYMTWSTAEQTSSGQTNALKKVSISNLRAAMSSGLIVAGDGIDVSASLSTGATTINMDLLASGGLKIDSADNELAVEPADFAGHGLEDDGSDNLKVKLNEASAGDSGLEVDGDGLRVKAASVTNAMLAGSIANDKLVNSEITFGADSGTAEAQALGDSFDFVGGTGLTSTMGTDRLEYKLLDTAVSAGDYGSASAVPSFTVDAQGRLTAASSQAYQDASDSVKGVASFDAADFDVASGAVSLEDSVVKSVTTDSGAMTPSSHGFSILGGEGMDVEHTGAAITVAGEDASDSNKGIASFDADHFVVTSGDVSLKAGSVEFADLAGAAVQLSSESFSDDDASLMTSAAILDKIEEKITEQDLDFAGDSGTGAVDLDSQSLSIVGTANEIETAASGQQVQIGLPDDVTIGNDLTVDRNVAIGSNLTVDNVSTFRNQLNVYNGASDSTVNLRVTATGNIDMVGSINMEGALTHDASSGNFAISSTNGEVHVEGAQFNGNNVIIPGNLTVQGTTTQVDSTQVNIGDNIITLNADETGTPSQDAGFEVERGTEVNKSFYWDESADKWTVGSETLVASTFEGDLTGNADTASALETARTLTIAGDASGSASFDGSADASISISLGNGVVDTAELASDSVTTDKIVADAVTEAKIADDAVQPEHLHDDVFGLGLAPNSLSNAIDVQVDDSSIEISADALQVKALGITNAMLAGSIASSKLAELDAFDTDDLSEGSSNLYYTDARARLALSVSESDADALSELSYDSSTGQFTFNGLGADEIRAQVSVTDSSESGRGALSYDSSTGVFTYEGISQAEVRGDFSVADSTSIDMSYDSSSGEFSAAAKVDDSSIEIDASEGLRLKDSGVVTAKIADDAVVAAKIADDAVTLAKLAHPASADSVMGMGIAWNAQDSEWEHIRASAALEISVDYDANGDATLASGAPAWAEQASSGAIEINMMDSAIFGDYASNLVMGQVFIETATGVKELAGTNMVIDSTEAQASVDPALLASFDLDGAATSQSGVKIFIMLQKMVGDVINS